MDLQCENGEDKGSDVCGSIRLYNIELNSGLKLRLRVIGRVYI
jgi:hypothetical protein